MHLQSSINRTKKIHSIQLHAKQSPVSIDDLVQMLQIDLEIFGDRDGFRRRLQRALDNAYQQGRY